MLRRRRCRPTRRADRGAGAPLRPELEHLPLYPNRTNVQFAQVVDRHTLRIEIWERGAGYTLASGTSSCAAAGAAIRTGRCASPVTVQMPGGEMLRGGRAGLVGAADGNGGVCVQWRGGGDVKRETC